MLQKIEHGKYVTEKDTRNDKINADKAAAKKVVDSMKDVEPFG